MSTRSYRYTFSGAATLTAPGGRFFFVKSATAPISISARGNTTAPIEFTDVGAGLKFGPVPAELRWTYLDITSGVAQIVDVIISDDAEVDVASTVNVAGSVAIMETPSTALATPVRVALNTATDTLIAAANASRRRITIQNPPGNIDSANIGPSGSLSTTRGLEVEPGAAVEICTTAAIYGRAVSNAPAVQVLEET